MPPLRSPAASVGQGLRQPPSRMRKWGRRLAWAGGIAGVCGVTADLATDHSLTRSLRAVSAFFRIIAMYKFETPDTAEAYFNMHQRAADSILHVCLTNEGLYVKLGQGLNAMSHILPTEYTNTLKVLLDNAKPVDMRDVRRTIEEETGRKLEDIFERFDEAPVASASIAQVHKAWLRNPTQQDHDGVSPLPPIQVAVKVRKPCIGKQSKWDIYTFQFFSFTIEKLFGLPTKWSRKTIVDGLKREMDFTIEAANAEQFRVNFRDQPQIYIPTIYKDMSSTRLMVMEWVDAAKLSETDKIRENFNENAVLKKLFDAFGDMVFKHGFVHCDPHAANILVRHMPDSALPASATARAASSNCSASRNERLSNTATAAASAAAPTTPRPVEGGGESATRSPQQQRTRASKNDFQIVLLDFGLCVPETERFRMQYALLFKSLVTNDMPTLKKVVMDWGISDPEIFASMQMQKPLKSMRAGSYEEVTKDEVRQMQREAHSRLKSFMIDEAKIPRELPLVGRGVDILRGINRMYGSPINRVNMFIKSAVQALGPLHDYDGVQQYLTRIKVLVAETQERERVGKAGAATTEGAAAANAGGESSFASVYDEGALQLRREQAVAMREIAAQRSGSLVSRVTDEAGSLYRAMLFHLVMFNLSLAHHVTRWYNLFVQLLVPGDRAAKLQAPSFEDRLENMENSMRVE